MENAKAPTRSNSVSPIKSRRKEHVRRTKSSHHPLKERVNTKSKKSERENVDTTKSNRTSSSDKASHRKKKERHSSSRTNKKSSSAAATISPTTKGKTKTPTTPKAKTKATSISTNNSAATTPSSSRRRKKQSSSSSKAQKDDAAIVPQTKARSPRKKKKELSSSASVSSSPLQPAVTATEAAAAVVRKEYLNGSLGSLFSNSSSCNSLVFDIDSPRKLVPVSAVATAATALPALETDDTGALNASSSRLAPANNIPCDPDKDHAAADDDEVKHPIDDNTVDTRTQEESIAGTDEQKLWSGIASILNSDSCSILSSEVLPAELLAAIRRGSLASTTVGREPIRCTTANRSVLQASDTTFQDGEADRLATRNTTEQGASAAVQSENVSKQQIPSHGSEVELTDAVKHEGTRGAPALCERKHVLPRCDPDTVEHRKRDDDDGDEDHDADGDGTGAVRSQCVDSDDQQYVARRNSVREREALNSSMLSFMSAVRRGSVIMSKWDSFGEMPTVPCLIEKPEKSGANSEFRLALEGETREPPENDEGIALNHLNEEGGLNGSVGDHIKTSQNDSCFAPEHDKPPTLMFQPLGKLRLNVPSKSRETCLVNAATPTFTDFFDNSEAKVIEKSKRSMPSMRDRFSPIAVLVKRMHKTCDAGVALGNNISNNRRRYVSTAERSNPLSTLRTRVTALSPFKKKPVCDALSHRAEAQFYPDLSHSEDDDEHCLLSSPTDF